MIQLIDESSSRKPELRQFVQIILPGKAAGFEGCTSGEFPLSQASMIDIAKIYYFVFGALTIAGGIMGFVTKNSIPSLVAGGVSGLLLLTAGFLIFIAKTQAGLILGIVASVLLAGKFLPDFILKKVWVPAGMMAILSLAGIVLTLLAWYKK
jgi:uncharacterized membrane protein (UPF0136 family)